MGQSKFSPIFAQTNDSSTNVGFKWNDENIRSYPTIHRYFIRTRIINLTTLERTKPAPGLHLCHFSMDDESGCPHPVLMTIGLSGFWVDPTQEPENRANLNKDPAFPFYSVFSSLILNLILINFLWIKSNINLLYLKI